MHLLVAIVNLTASVILYRQKHYNLMLLNFAFFVANWLFFLYL